MKQHTLFGEPVKHTCHMCGKVHTGLKQKCDRCLNSKFHGSVKYHANAVF